MATSMIDELFEWGAAELFGGDLGMADLGTQGDIWDVDMALASLGAFTAMTITLCINMRIQETFSEEWTLSLSIKSNRTLGEDEILRLRSQYKNSD
jgi:putative membrane protein